MTMQQQERFKKRVSREEARQFLIAQMKQNRRRHAQEEEQSRAVHHTRDDEGRRQMNEGTSLTAQMATPFPIQALAAAFRKERQQQRDNNKEQPHRVEDGVEDNQFRAGVHLGGGGGDGDELLLVDETEDFLDLMGGDFDDDGHQSTDDSSDNNDDADDDGEQQFADLVGDDSCALSRLFLARSFPFMLFSCVSEDDEHEDTNGRESTQVEDSTFLSSLLRLLLPISTIDSSSAHQPQFASMLCFLIRRALRSAIRQSLPPRGLMAMAVARELLLSSSASIAEAKEKEEDEKRRVLRALTLYYSCEWSEFQRALCSSLFKLQHHHDHHHDHHHESIADTHGALAAVMSKTECKRMAARIVALLSHAAETACKSTILLTDSRKEDEDGEERTETMDGLGTAQATRARRRRGSVLETLMLCSLFVAFNDATNGEQESRESQSLSFDACVAFIAAFCGPLPPNSTTNALDEEVDDNGATSCGKAGSRHNTAVIIHEGNTRKRKEELPMVTADVETILGFEGWDEGLLPMLRRVVKALMTMLSGNDLSVSLASSAFASSLWLRHLVRTVGLHWLCGVRVDKVRAAEGARSSSLDMLRLFRVASAKWYPPHAVSRLLEHHRDAHCDNVHSSASLSYPTLPQTTAVEENEGGFEERGRGEQEEQQPFVEVGAHLDHNHHGGGGADHDGGRYFDDNSGGDEHTGAAERHARQLTVFLLETLHSCVVDISSPQPSALSSSAATAGAGCAPPSPSGVWVSLLTETAQIVVGAALPYVATVWVAWAMEEQREVVSTAGELLLVDAGILTCSSSTASAHSPSSAAAHTLRGVLSAVDPDGYWLSLWLSNPFVAWLARTGGNLQLAAAAAESAQKSWRHRLASREDEKKTAATNAAAGRQCLHRWADQIYFALKPKWL